MAATRVREPKRSSRTKANFCELFCSQLELLMDRSVRESRYHCIRWTGLRAQVQNSEDPRDIGKY